MAFLSGLLNPSAWQYGGSPMAPLLGQYYDPAEMRKLMLSRGLLGMGKAMLSQGPSRYPENPLRVGLAGAAEGIEGAQGDYMTEAMAAQQFAQQQQDREARKQQMAQEASDKFQKDWRFKNWLQSVPEEHRAAIEAGALSPEDYYKAQNPGMFAGSGGAAEYGLNPIVTQNPDTGEYMLLQPSKRGGSALPVQLPDGYEYVPTTRTLDTGTGFETIPTKGVGRVGGTIPKNVAEEKTLQEIGKGQGEAVVDFRRLDSKMPGLEGTIRKLDKLAEDATYTFGGQTYNFAKTQLGFNPSKGQIARTEYNAVVNNQILPLLRDTFGAQFTQREGETLRATLGDPNVTPAEKQAVLRAFFDQKRRDVEALRQQAYGPSDGQSGANDDPLGIMGN